MLQIKEPKRDYAYMVIKHFRPDKRKVKKVNGADYLYVIISALILLGIVQRFQINQLKSIAPKNVLATQITITPTPVIKYIEKKDERVTKLEKYLGLKASPLKDYAEKIIKESDEHGIDYTLMVSISGMESAFATKCNQACHNPFGLGGTKPLCFSTWEEAIEFEAKLLDRDYRINMANGIQSKYCPAFECNPAWSSTIVNFSREIMEGGEL